MPRACCRTQVGSFKHGVAFGGLNCCGVGNQANAVRGGVCLVSDLREQLGSAGCKFHSFISALAAYGHSLDGFGHIFAHGLDHLFDLSGRSCGALAEFFDFVCDDAKASTLGSGLRRQYRRVEGEQVGAICDLVNYVRDFADLLRAFARVG